MCAGVCSEATQCVTLFSRQGTNDTIDEAEDKREQLEHKQKTEEAERRDKPEEEERQEVETSDQGKQEVLPVSHLVTREVKEDVLPVSDQLTREVTEEVEEEVEVVKEMEEEGGEEVEKEVGAKVEKGEEVGEEVKKEVETEVVTEVGAEVGEEAEREVDEEVQWDLVDPEEADECVSEDEEGGERMQQDEGEWSGVENVVSGPLFTPDTDAPNTSDADVPPSYSKAVSFDRLSVSSDDSDSDKRLMLMTPDSKSDLDDPLLPSMTTDMTASELLLNKWVISYRFLS